MKLDLARFTGAVAAAAAAVGPIDRPMAMMDAMYTAAFDGAGYHNSVQYNIMLGRRMSTNEYLHFQKFQIK